MKTDINIYIALTLLFWHWVADFVFQTDKQAQGKSKNWEDLLSHTLTYSVSWLVPICILFSMNPDLHEITIPFTFVGATFLCHTITDYFTSRLNSKLWAEKKVHWFFVSIGFDQFLHYLQLIITYQLLM